MTLSDWTSIAIIILAVETFFLAIALGAMVYFSLRGMRWIIRQVEAVAPRAQSTVRRAAEFSEQASERIAAPLISASEVKARLQRTLTAAISMLTGRREV